MSVYPFFLDGHVQYFLSFPFSYVSHVASFYSPILQNLPMHDTSSFPYLVLDVTYPGPKANEKQIGTQKKDTKPQKSLFRPQTVFYKYPRVRKAPGTIKEWWSVKNTISNETNKNAITINKEILMTPRSGLIYFTTQEKWKHDGELYM